MRTPRRLLTLLLCLLLALAPLGSAHTEAAPEPAGLAEATEAPAPSDIAENAQALPEAEIAEESGSEVTEQSKPAPEATEQPEPAPSSEAEEPAADRPPEAEPVAAIDFTRDAGASPAFTSGYAALLGEALGYAGPQPDAQALFALRGGVVCALRRAGEPDRIEAAFDGGGTELRAWFDAACLRPLSPEEAERFAQERAAQGALRSEAAGLPLDAPACAALPAPEAEPDASAAPEREAPAEAEPATEPDPAPALLVPHAVLALGVTETRDIGAGFSDGGSYPIEYLPDDPDVVAVSPEGQVTALAQGTANIELRSAYGSATVSVSVQKKAAQLKLTAPRKTMGAPDGGLTDTLRLSVNLPEGEASGLRFSSKPESVATVDEQGVVTALATGTVTVTARNSNGQKASVTLTVKKAPTAIELEPLPEALAVGERAALGATLGKNRAGGCRFHVEPEGALNIDPDTGELVALRPGEASVIVESYNGKAASQTVAVRPVAKELALDPAELTLGLGESAALPKVLLTADGEPAAGRCEFQSLTPNRASVSGAKGKISAKRKGDARIQVTAFGGASAELLVHVVAAPSKLSLSAPHKVLGVGEELPLATKILPSGAASQLQFSCKPKSVASVNEQGVVTALAAGKVTVTVRSFNGKTASVKLTVRTAPEAVQLPEVLEMGLGEVYAIAHTPFPEGSGGGARYSVDDEAIASIDEASGEITAKVLGATTVRVETYNGCTASCELRVKAAPTGIELPDESFKLSLKDSYQLQTPVLLGEDVASAKIRYSSSNSACVRVSASGKVTALREGKATITARTYNDQRAKISVTVKAAPTAIAFSPKTLRLFIDRECAPTVSFKNASTKRSYTLTSSDPAVVAVLEDGVTLRGVSAGKATVTARSYNGKKAKLKVTVPALPESLALEPSPLVLGMGDCAELTAAMPEGQGAELEFSIDDDSVARLERTDNEHVTVTALARGETVIRARSQNGLVSEAPLAVREAPTALSVSPACAVRSLDEAQLQLSVGYGGPDEGGSVRYTSSNKKIATVSAAGLVTFLKTGKVQITATSYNGHAAICQLTIGKTPGEMHFEQSEYLVALGDVVRIPASFNKGCESYALSAEGDCVRVVGDDMVRGEQLGSATLTARSRSSLLASCTVRVVAAPTGIELDPAEYKLVIGRSSQRTIEARVLGEGAGSVHFFTDDPAVATVDYATGLLTAQDAGDCTVTAVTYNGYSAQCAVHVSYLLKGLKIGIDPGHQLHGDMGREASSPRGGTSKYRVSHSSAGVAGVSEHVINLQVGLKLRKALQKLGATVYMTRTKADVNISNKERALMMNKYEVDIVLRLHCNSWTSPSTNGVSVFTRGSWAYDNAKLGSKVLATESKAASAIYNYFRAATGCGGAGIFRNDDYTMNNWCTVPCVLVEMGFMTNPKEGWDLVNSSYQTKMVQGMIRGICSALDRKLPTEW